MTDRHATPRTAGLWDYLKEAFLFRWNLLAFGGATIAALLGPHPDVILPLVAAAELVYLAGLTSIPKFRQAIDTKVHTKSKDRLATQPNGQASMRVLAAMFNDLESKARQRFEQLHGRCIAMQRIAHGVRGATGASGHDDLRTPALDKLLWVFLRLLHSQQALDRFLRATDAVALKKQLDAMKEREEAAQKSGDPRIARALRDSVVTAELRLDNYQKAEQNAEFVAVELDRIEGKIQAISEMAVSHQDPDYISAQVDSVADSMQHTEQAIRELNAITGLTSDMEAPPPILETDVSKAVRS